MFCVCCGKFTSEVRDEDMLDPLWICPKCMKELSGEEIEYYFGVIESQSTSHCVG